MNPSTLAPMKTDEVRPRTEVTARMVRLPPFRNGGRLLGFASLSGVLGVLRGLGGLSNASW